MRARIQQLLRGEIPPPPVARTIGFSLVAAADGRATMKMDADPARHANPMGTVHGGVLCDIADGAMGIAYASTLEDGESFTTLELKINFLRPVWQGILTAQACVVQQGRTVGMVECSIRDSDGRLIARATSTCMTLRGKDAAGR